MRIRGVELELHPEGEALSDHIRRENDFFEAEILDYLRDNHKFQRVIIDVGANIGNHTLYFANFLVSSFIWAFEPVLENFLLLENSLKHHIQERPMTHAIVIPLNYALSSKTQKVRITPNFGNMGASQISDDGAREVKATTIDTVLSSESNVTLIKIDVEGYEPEVIKGAQETIQLHRPLILIEDWGREYDSLLPDYEIEKAWPEHQTFLYRWKE